MTFLPGTRLGSSEILAAIGAGGMGEVYGPLTRCPSICIRHRTCRSGSRSYNGWCRPGKRLLVTSITARLCGPGRKHRVDHILIGEPGQPVDMNIAKSVGTGIYAQRVPPAIEPHDVERHDMLMSREPAA